MVGQHDVVMRGEGNQGPARFAQGMVAVRVAEASALAQVEQADAWIGEALHQRDAAIGAAIGHHQKLEIGLGLGEHAADRDAEHLGAVVRGQQYREAWPAHPPVTPAKE